MNKLVKKLRHNTLFGFILGGIVFSSIVYGINEYESNSIEYSPTDESWKVNNVNEAINSLYSMKIELDSTKTSLNNIKSIGDAVAGNILKGKTAVVKGNTVTGTMTNKAGTSQVGSSFSVNESGTLGQDDYTATGSIKIPVAGYYGPGSTLTFDLTENNNSCYSLGTDNEKANSRTITYKTSMSSDKRLLITFYNSDGTQAAYITQYSVYNDSKVSVNVY